MSQVTVIHREVQVAAGDIRYHLSNGWYIQRCERLHRSYQGNRYELWEPGGSQDGRYAGFRGGTSSLADALGVANGRTAAA